MLTIRNVAAIGVLGVLLGGPCLLHGQTRSAEKLAAAKAIKCVFSTMAAGDWNSSGPLVETKPATLALGFEEIDVDEGSARVVGAFGPADIIVRLSSGTLHLVQSFREGPLYATTIFPYETRPGRLRAVHTRHEFTEVSLPGFTSRPEQYYGACEITK